MEYLYTYNVRGWLTGINGPRFSETLTYETPRSGSTQPGQWGGNISSSQWRTSMSSSDWKWYDYAYDMLGRLAEAWFGETEAASSVDYKLAYSYDLNGNLERRTSLNNAWAIENHERETRWMWSQADGNRPTGWSQERYGVTLMSGTPSRPPQRIYQLDPSGSQGESYSYDSSGNRTATLSSQGDTLSAMRYNHLHLPAEFTTAAGDTVNYVYSADGEKLYVEENPSGGTVQGTEYAANYRIENGTVTMIHTDAGYYTPYPASSGGTGASYRHIWYLKDHLGNNRALVDGSGNAVALHDYDPFGEEIATVSSSQLYLLPAGAKVSPYKYGGKEWSASTSTYDFEARYLSPSFHRFTMLDPLAEKYYSISPYAYCADDPVNLVDPEGMEIWIYLNRGQENEQALRYESGALFYANGDLYDGDDPFARRVLTSLYIIDSIKDDEISYVMSKLISSPRRHIIEKDLGNDDATGVVEKTYGKSLAHSGIPVASDIHVSLNKRTIDDDLPNTPTTTLGHELMHAFDYDQGNFKGMINRPKSVYDVDPMEIRAVYFENIIRKNRGLPIRMTYGSNRISRSAFKNIKIR